MKQILSRIDWLLIAPAFILVVLSLTTLFSLNPLFFQSQVIALVLALVVFILSSQIDYRAVVSLGKPIYFFSLLLLFIVFIVGIESHGASRWIEVFGIRFQFSELCKPLLALSLASYLSEEEHRTFRSYMMIGIFLVPIFAFIFIQPDLGNALIYAIVTALVMITYGYPIKWFFLTAIPFISAMPYFWLHLHDYQKQRIATFLEPTADPSGASYNVIQAIIAVGSGGFIGKGFGAGSQSGLRFLPERQTDFIFATLSEGLGFFGSMIVVLCFFALAVRMYVIFSQGETTYEKVVVSCAFFFLVTHFFVNVGMNAGIVPVVGVTLPFVSQGGSSLLSNFFFLGILSSLYTSHKRHKVLEIR